MRGAPKVSQVVVVKGLDQSPKMSIEKVTSDNVVETTWFANGVLQKGSFNTEILEKAVEEDAAPAAKTAGKKGKK
jgi:uncharacterized protein YodC (DUF2158 family)